MYGAGLNVFAVWGYVIANTRPPGRIELNPRMLANTLGCSLEEVEQAIEFLASPDPNSRTKIEEGRRLVRVGEFEYTVPTYQIYREKRDKEERRQYNREKKRESRARQRMSKGVNDSQQCQPKSAKAEAEAEAEASSSIEEGAEEEDEGVSSKNQPPSLAKVKAYALGHGVTEELAERFHAYYTENNTWHNQHNRLINWQAKLVKWQVRDRGAVGDDLPREMRAKLEDKLEELLERLGNHPGRGSQRTEEQYEQWKALKAELKPEIDKLRERLGQ
jgi:hypothetical protein